MHKQTTNTLLMIEPIAFGFNDQTAENNYFQQNDNAEQTKLQELALLEFNRSVEALREKGINVVVIKDTPEPHTPDSIFPNNWISFHNQGRVALYPMYAENRRQERRMDIIETLKGKGYQIAEITEYYSQAEKENRFLEGTGSMILDRVNMIAYAALSERTDLELFNRFCKDFGFTPVAFHANQTVGDKRLPIYHTNVMMCVGDNYAVVCLDSIDDSGERKQVVESLEKSHKEIVPISEEQMHQFAGNMLQVEDVQGKTYLVMSETAYQSLNPEQIRQLTKHNDIIRFVIPTIEKYGGGSARCMLAEVFS